MPLIKIDLEGQQRGWALWHITETETELTLDEPCPIEITNAVKRREWLASREALKLLVCRFGLTYQGVEKDEFGKPFLRANEIEMSLSHSYPYVAVQLNGHGPAGIDIEQPKPKLLDIAPRVLSMEEQKDAGVDIVKNCIYWCAKESLYKVYGQRRLSFSKNLSIEPFGQNGRGIIKGIITIDEHVRVVPLLYEVEANFVIVRVTGL